MEHQWFSDAVKNVIVHSLAQIEDGAILVRKNSDIDMASSVGAHGASVESGEGVTTGIGKQFTLKKVRSINVSLFLHVLNRAAFI